MAVVRIYMRCVFFLVRHVFGIQSCMDNTYIGHIGVGIRREVVGIVVTSMLLVTSSGPIMLNTPFNIYHIAQIIIIITIGI